MSPTRSGAFLKSTDELGEGLDLGGGILGRFSLLLDTFNLSFGESHRGQLGVCHIAGELLQGLGQDLRGEPGLFAGLSHDRLSKGLAVNGGILHLSRELNRALVQGAQSFGRLSQSSLKDRAAHTGVHNGVPVLKTDTTR